MKQDDKTTTLKQPATDPKEEETKEEETPATMTKQNTTTAGSADDPDQENGKNEGLQAVGIASSAATASPSFESNVRDTIEPLPAASTSNPARPQRVPSTPGAHRVDGPNAHAASIASSTGLGLQPPQEEVEEEEEEEEEEEDERTLLVEEAFVVESVCPTPETATETHDDPSDPEVGRISGSSSSDEQEVIEGKPMQDDITRSKQKKGREHAQKKRSPLWVVLGVLFVIVILLVVTLYALPDAEKKETDNLPSLESYNSDSLYPSTTNTSQPPSAALAEPAVYPPFREDLLSIAIQNAIQDVDSPSYHANLWMLQDPHLDSYSPGRQLQRFHMAWLYFTTSGEHWIQKENWLSYNISECQWYSSWGHHQKWSHVPSVTKDLALCDSEGNLRVLDLSNNNLRGTFPAHEWQHPHLMIYNLSDNDIHGAFPMGSNAGIQVIAFSNDSFSEVVVGSAALEASRVKVVAMDNNNFHTQLRGAMFPLMQEVEHWNISHNHFGGVLATEIGLLTKLLYGSIGHNDLTGTLPSELGLLATSLQSMDVSGNRQLSGTIPAQWGLLANVLQSLDISETNITGPVPDGLCDINPEMIIANLQFGSLL